MSRPSPPPSAVSSSSSTSSLSNAGIHTSTTKHKQQQPAATKTSRSNANRLFLTFSLLTCTVAIINIKFHHLFHEEHVIDKSRRHFQGRFRTRRERDDSPSIAGDHIIAQLGSSNSNAVTDNQNDSASNSDNELGGHKLAGLKCQEKYGGPDDAYAEKEMAFWSDIPSDSSYKSLFMDNDTERYLAFEPDHGGWNNIRMAMETALVMSHAMGRTLVLPPEQRFYLLGKQDASQKTDFDFGDFFHLDSIAMEHEGFNVISSEEFLIRLGSTGQLINVKTGQPEIWKENAKHTSGNVKSYLQKVGVNPSWNPTNCIAAFPAGKGADAIDTLQKAFNDIMTEKGGRKRPTLEEFEGNPVPVNASLEERMREMLADRSELCIYDEQLQKAPVLYFSAAKETRLLTHFYAFIFFADWRADLWSKRFVRDHLRYIDEIMCAAARIVQAVRQQSKHEEGLFDSMHVRRGDFQYKKTRLDAPKLLEKSKNKLEEGGLLYIATDERDKSFFDPFRKHYDIVFLDDFKHLLTKVNTNYYGMLDQLVASKGRVFFGTWFSTLSGYVNRMRGYYIAKHKLDGYKDGTMESYYFYPDEKYNQMKQYMPVKKPIYMREFPISWRDIDVGIEELEA